MRALSCGNLAALTLAVLLAASASAQDCPTCGPHHFGHFGHGHHACKTGDYARYGGFDAHGYYWRGLHGPPSGPGNCMWEYGQPDLFRQYYVGNNCGGAPAAMYPAPMTHIPPHVGHVYYTYQPLYPHEFLYPHHRTYHRYYDDGRGLTRAHVSWMASPTLAAFRAIPFHW
jgi:hypothetical protein